MFKPTPLKPVFYKFVFLTQCAQKGLFSVVSNSISVIKRTSTASLQKLTLITGVALVALAVGLPSFLTGRANAATPTLNFQARLENSSGSIAPDGNYNVEFKLYQGGTTTGGGTLKWTEDYLNSATQGVRVANGYLTVNLGSITAFPGTINWDDDLFLSMNIGGTTTGTPSWDGEMSPYLKLTSVPYAFQAQSAQQLQTIQGTNTGTLLFDNLTANRKYILPDTGLATTASPGTICVFNGAVSNCPAATGSAYYIHNDTALQTSANFNIQASDSGVTGTVAGILRGAAGGQTVDLLQLQGSDGTTLAAFTAGGDLQVANSIDTRTATGLSVGTANATSITIGQSGVTATVQGALTVDQAATLNSTLDVTGLTTLTGGATIGGLTVNTSTATNDTLGLTVTTIGSNAFAGTITNADLTAVRTWTLPDESGTICTTGSVCAGYAAAGGSGSYIQNQNTSAQATSKFWISDSGRADTSFLAPSFDVAVAGTLDVGTATATAINIGQSGVTTTIQGALTVSEAATFNSTVQFNDNVTVAANKTITLTGGATGSRPASPTEGTLFYDTTTKQLLVYANGKWQADRHEAILVAASNSSQADKDAADYVADGNTAAANDGDQVQIQAALDDANPAGTGRKTGKVYLFAGTYTADATILIPNNTTLAGAGSATVVQLADLDVSENLIENSDTSAGTGVVIQDLKLDGQSNLNTAGTQYGVYLQAMGGNAGSSARQGAKISQVIVTRFRNHGIFINGSNNTITGSTSRGNGAFGIYLNANENVITGSVAQGNQYGIYSSGKNVITGNVAEGNSQTGIYGAFGSVITGNTATNNTVSGITAADTIGVSNTVSGNRVTGGQYGIQVTAQNSSISGNTIYQPTTYGIYITSTTNDTVNANTIYDSGGNTANNGIYLNNSDNISITSNTIIDSSATTTNYAISISNNTSDTNYLADNTLGGGSINDAGTGTIYGGQLNSSGNYLIQPTGTIELLKNTNVTGNLAVTGTGSFTGGSLTVGTTTATDDTLKLQVTTGGSNAFTGTITNTDLTAARTWTLPDASGTICVQVTSTTTTNCDFSGTGGYVQFAPNTAQVDSSTNSSIFINKTGASGNILELQKAGTDVFTIANSGDATFNQNVTVATGKTLTITGGNTTTRNALPTTEGSLFYDTSTHQLMVYNGSKWKADGSEAVLVAANDSSDADKAAADYIADGTGDQTEINSALTAASSSGTRKTGKVYLFAGTYTINASISMPNNTTLAGSGKATIVKLANSINADIKAITNTDAVTGTGVTIRDLKIDGNRTNNTAGNQYGVYLDHMGDATTNRAGGMVTNIEASNFRSYGIVTFTSSNTVITGNTTNNSTLGTSAGILISAGSYNTITDNFANANTTGIWVYLSSNNTVSGNNTYGNGTAGNGANIYIFGGSYNTVTSNVIASSPNVAVFLSGSTYNTLSNNVVTGNLSGIYLYSGSNSNTISGNTLRDNGGATTNNSIVTDASDSNTITGNNISDSSATTNNYAINILNATSDTNLVSGNSLNGGSINNAGTGSNIGSNILGGGTLTGAGTSTVWNGQLDSSGNLALQAAGTNSLNLNTGGAGTVNLGATNTATVNIGSTAATTSIVLQAGSSAGNGVAIQSSSATAFRIQNSGASFTLFTADASATKRVTIGTTATPYGSTSSNGDLMVVGNAEVQGLLYIGNSGSDAIYTASAGGPLRFKGTARNDVTVTLSPEFAGATLYGTGIGTMTASFCSNTVGSMANVGTGICASGQSHNYYEWFNGTQASAQTYSIYTKWQVPSNADSAAGTMSFRGYGWRTNGTTDAVTADIYDASGTVCASGVVLASGTAAWTQSSATNLSGCSYTANSTLTIKITLTAGQNNYARVGELTINYKSLF